MEYPRYRLPKICLIGTEDIQNILKEFAERSNGVQNYFRFELFPPLHKNSKLVSIKEIDEDSAFAIVRPLKKTGKLSSKDSMIAFTKAILSAPEAHMTNLFFSLSPANIAVVSLKFLEWEIVERKLTSELKFHALAHLIMGILIERYTDLESHEETKGCLLDFCNELSDFNAMLGRRYFLCEEYCRAKFEKSPIKIPLEKILDDLRRNASYSKTVVVAGSYGKNEDNRLEKIKDKLGRLGYEAVLVRDLPDNHYGSREKKFVDLALQSHFVVCENSFASGHIAELAKCVQNEIVTCILQESSRRATSLQVHYPYLYNFIEAFCYGANSQEVNNLVCRHLASDLETSIANAAEWAEEYHRKLGEIYAKIYEDNRGPANR